MKRQDIMGFAEQLRLGPQSRELRKGWVNFACPWAPTRHAGGTDKSKGFGISCDDGHSYYFCLACKTKGPFTALPAALGRLRDEDNTALVREIERAEIVGPRVEPKEWEERYTHAVTANAQETVSALPSPDREFEYPVAVGHPYLTGRGIGSVTALRLGLRYDAYQRRILFPVYTARGQFTGFSGRAIEGPIGVDDDGEPIDHLGRKYIKVRDYFGLRKREHILGEHRIRYRRRERSDGHVRQPAASWATPFVIASEGLLDYAYFAELGYHLQVSLMGSWFSELRAKRMVSYGLPLILFMDNDKAGEDAVEYMTREFWQKLPLYRVEYPSELVDADPNTTPADTIHEMIRSRKLITSNRVYQVLTHTF